MESPALEAPIGSTWTDPETATVWARADRFENGDPWFVLLAGEWEDDDRSLLAIPLLQQDYETGKRLQPWTPADGLPAQRSERAA